MGAMRRVVAWAMIVVAALPVMAGLGGCAAEEKHSVLPFVELPDLEGAGLRKAWERRVALQPGEELLQAWRVGNSVYLSTTDSRLFRIDAKSGVLAWWQGLGEENIRMRRPIELRTTEGGPPSQVLMVTLGQTFIFDMLTGELIRQKNLGMSAASNPVLVKDTLCIGGAERFVGLYMDITRRWNIRADGDLFLSTPVAVEDNIIVASKTGQLWRISTDTGLWDWKDRKTNGMVTAGLVADGRAVYVACLDQRLYAFQIDSGSLLWDCQLEGILDKTPAMGGTVVMVPASGRGLYAVGRQNGDRRWEAPGVISVATVTGDHAWVGDASGNLKSLQLETGEVLSSTYIPEALLFVRNIEDDQVILVNRSGVVGAYMPK